MVDKNKCWVVDCGQLPYEEALDFQKKLALVRAKDKIPDVLLLLEHPATITMGVKATDAMLKVPRRVLEQRGIPVINVQRGGKATLHSPGQIVGYPIRKIDLNAVDKHILGMEELMLKVLKSYNIDARKSYEIDAEKKKRLPGAWITLNRKDCKLGSIGVEIRDGVTMHGFALNANNDVHLFDLIDMCGFKDKFAMSMSKVLERPIAAPELKQRLIGSFAETYGYTVEQKSYLSLRDALNKLSFPKESKEKAIEQE